MSINRGMYEDVVSSCEVTSVLVNSLWSTLWTVAFQASLSMGFSSKNTGVSCHSLQRIFLTVSRCASPWAYVVWDSLYFLNMGDYFLSHVREVLTIISWNIFSDLFSFSSSSRIIYFVCCPRGLWEYPHFSSFFFLYSAPC